MMNMDGKTHTQPTKEYSHADKYKNKKYRQTHTHTMQTYRHTHTDRHIYTTRLNT